MSQTTRRPKETPEKVVKTIRREEGRRRRRIGKVVLAKAVRNIAKIPLDGSSPRGFDQQVGKCR